MAHMKFSVETKIIGFHAFFSNNEEFAQNGWMNCPIHFCVYRLVFGTSQQEWTVQDNLKVLKHNKMNLSF